MIALKSYSLYIKFCCTQFSDLFIFPAEKCFYKEIVSSYLVEAIRIFPNEQKGPISI